MKQFWPFIFFVRTKREKEINYLLLFRNIGLICNIKKVDMPNLMMYNRRSYCESSFILDEIFRYLC